MANTTRTLLVMALFATASSSARAAANDNAPAKIVLHVEDFALLLSPTISDAENEVRAVFRQAGVQVTWLNGNPSPRMISDSNLHVSVKILNRQMADRKSRTEGTSSDVLGQSAREACQVWIFYDRVTALTNPLPGGGGEILGRVIAHEVGHLLLPAQSHSDKGIMRGTFDLRPKVPPVFTAAQAATIRSMLSQRVRCLKEGVVVNRAPSL